MTYQLLSLLIKNSPPPSMANLSLLSLLALLLLVPSSIAGKEKLGYYELKRGDFSIRITSWGATILNVYLPDSKGNVDDVVLGYQTIGGYVNETTYFGALVGRVANRIGGAQFVLDGKVHKLFANDKKNSLHGGHRGFNQVFWTLTEKGDGDFPYIKLYYHSFDGEQGFPGDLDVYVTYKITGDYEYTVTMEAKALTKATPVNLAQHTYWNLAGEGSGTILDNKIQIFADSITPVDVNLIPTGKIAPITGTAYDFQTPEAIGSRIDKVGTGYDVNYVLNSEPDANGMRKTAVVEDPKSGRKLELWADKPGVQFYSGNMIGNVKGKRGHVYKNYDGLALETQGFPDSVNQPNFPSQIVKPGETYHHHMQYKFSF